MKRSRRSRIHIKKSRRGSYGHHTVAEEKADIRKGGAIAKKAQFALNARKWKRGGKRRARR